MGPWEIVVIDPSNLGAAVVDGKPVMLSGRLGFARIGNIAIELIEPGENTSITAESLARHGGADHIHHVQCTYASDDYQAVVDSFRGKGVEPVRSGSIPARRTDWAYFDTQADLGFLLEVSVQSADPQSAGISD